MRTRLSILTLLLLTAASLHAQTDLALFVESVTLDDGGFFIGANVTGDLLPEWENAIGFGASVNHFWARNLSTELGVSIADADVELDTAFGIGPLSGGSMQIMPVTATLQWHFAPEATFDPYIGAGGAYVMLDDLEGFDDRNTQIEAIELEDKAAFLVNAGLRVNVSPSWGLHFDAKYIPLTVEAHTRRTFGLFQLPGEAELNPLLLSGGVRFRF